MRSRATLFLAVLFAFAVPAFAQSPATLELMRALANSGRWATGPRYTTANRPPCNTSNRWAMISNTTTGNVEVCDGSTYVTTVFGGGGLTPGTTAVTGGTAGKNLYVGASAILQQSPFYNTTDTLPTAMYLSGEHAFAAATGGNATGGALSLYGGIGQRLYTVVDYTLLALKTVTITVNGTATVRTEGTNWTAATSNAATATSLATAIDAIAGVGATASAATVRVTADDGTYTLTIATDAAAGGMTATSGTDGTFTLGPTTIRAWGTGVPLTLSNGTGTGNIFVANDNVTPVFTIADGTDAGGIVTGASSATLGVIRILQAAAERNSLTWGDGTRVGALFAGVNITGIGTITSGPFGLFVGNGASSLVVNTAGDISLTNLKLTAGTMTAEKSGELREETSSFTWTNAQVVTALAGAGDILVATLPAKTEVIDAQVVIVTAALTSTTLTVACGRTSALYNDYIVASDAMAATNTVYGDAAAERGTNLTGFDLPSYTGTTAVNCHWVKTGADPTASTGRVVLTTRLLP